MKSKLLMSAIAMPAAFALGTSAFAQDTTPPPAAEPPAVERMETTPAPTPVTPAPGAAAETTATGAFATAQSADEWRSSRLVGTAVYNEANERVGDISELVLDADGKISHAVIGVGGFLGIGEKLVAVNFSDLNIAREENGNARVTMNTTKEALQNAPDYKYHTTGGMGTSD
ncbi:MAG TPA: PRC-barrel domain-containing protein [Hyphomicrobium sp.]|nr:PRC-barrel domain-containing protein [Hyphomicrobium sp.]HRO49181.1 PRC-barrel domain-containing protein [Hyphomicrobium sp.]